jgi:hypothetical protein
MMHNLQRELNAAASAVRQRHLDQIRALGVSMAFLADVGRDHVPFGISAIEPIGGGLYQPGEGMPHLILPVVEEGNLVDLCAVHSSNPSSWLLRSGNGWALGLKDGLNRWLWYSPEGVNRFGEARHQVGRPTLIFSSPIDWLQGAGEGICVLDWSAPEVRQLDVLPEVICSDRETALLLERTLHRPVRLPKISVMEVARAA